MKSQYTAIVLLLACACFAQEISTQSSKLSWNGSVMEWSVEGVPPVRFTPAAQTEASFSSACVVTGREKSEAIYLWGNDVSLAFTLDKSTGNLRVGAAWNAGFRVDAPVEAVVLPDGFGEDVILEPGDTSFRVPSSLPFFMALLAGEKATLSCIPFKDSGDVQLSSDLRSADFTPAPLQEYTFVIGKGEKIWHKVSEKLNSEKRLPVAWEAPFPARFRAAYPIAQGFIPYGDGLHYVWNLMLAKQGKDIYFLHRPPRMSVSDKKNYVLWCSGFDGTIGYPAVVDVDGNLLMRYSNHAGRPKGFYDETRPIYIYAYDHGDLKDGPAMPVDFLSDSARAKLLNIRNASIGIGPATCHLTSEVIEPLFRHGEARSKPQELTAALQKTQIFVESVRMRIESYRSWANCVRSKATELLTGHPECADELNALLNALDNYETLYTEILPRMKTPRDARALQEKLMTDVANEELDEEDLEDSAMEFGRETRTIGGAQDGLVAKFRNIAKTIRQKMVTTYSRTTSPELRKFCLEVYDSTTPLMQDYLDHEGK